MELKSTNSQSDSGHNAFVSDEASPDAQETVFDARPHAERLSGPVQSDSVANDPNARTLQDVTPPPPPMSAPWLPNRGIPRMPSPPLAAQPLVAPPPIRTHVPWQVAQSWGPTTITITANTAAGASYLFWWLSGLLVYFNERTNRYVRFHAMQSVLLTSVLTVFGVLVYILRALCLDLTTATHWTFFGTLGNGLAWIAGILVIPGIWLFAMIAAWTGHYLHLPIVGAYAERYAAPPLQQPTPPHYP